MAKQPNPMYLCGLKKLLKNKKRNSSEFPQSGAAENRTLVQTHSP